MEGLPRSRADVEKAKDLLLLGFGLLAWPFFAAYMSQFFTATDECKVSGPAPDGFIVCFERRDRLDHVQD